MKAVQQTTTAADAGYGAGADLQAAVKQGQSVLVPPAEGKPAHDNPYAGQHFRYDPIQQTVTCPQGQSLAQEGHTTKQGINGSNVIVAAVGTVRCGETARVTPRGGR